MTKTQMRRSYRRPSDNFTLKGFDGYIYVPEGKSLLKNALRGMKYRGANQRHNRLQVSVLRGRVKTREESQSML